MKNKSSLERGSGSAHNSPSQNVVETRLQFNVVLVDVIIKILSAQDLGYSNQLLEKRKPDKQINKLEV